MVGVPASRAGQEGVMTTVFIVIGVAMLVTLFVAFRYDHRHKRLDD